MGRLSVIEKADRSAFARAGKMDATLVVCSAVLSAAMTAVCSAACSGKRLARYLGPRTVRPTAEPRALSQAEQKDDETARWTAATSEGC